MTRPTDHHPTDRSWLDPAGAAPPADPRLAGPRPPRRAGKAIWIVAGITAVVALVTGAAVVIFLMSGPAGTPSAARSSAASPTPSTAATTAAPAVVAGPGTIFYFVGGSPNATAKLFVSWRPGGSIRTLASLEYSVAATSLNVSPDGQKIAYVKPVTSDTDDRGDLHVANVDGSHDTVLRHSVDAWAVEPAWSPDGTRLVVADWSEQGAEPGILTIATRAFQALPAFNGGVHFHWSGDGTRLAWLSGTGVVTTGPADGSSGPSPVPGTGGDATPARFIPSLESVSPDGSRVAVQVPGPDDTLGDISRAFECNTLLDVATGKAVALPITGKILQMRYRRDGSLLVRVEGAAHNTLVVLRPDLTVATSVDEPAKNRPWLILAETP